MMATQMKCLCKAFILYLFVSFFKKTQYENILFYFCHSVIFTWNRSGNPSS